MSFNRSGYIGRAPGDSSVTIARKSYEPTGVQTDFTFSAGYTPGYCDVYLNGVKLIDATDYTASNGSTVGLTSAAASGDIVEIVAYKAFNLGAPISDVTGNLDVTGNISASSSITADGSFYGDGSNLSNIAGIGITQYIAANSLTVIGSPGVSTITRLGVTDAVVTGIITANGLSGNVTGAACTFTTGTFNSDVSIGGTLTYEDVTNVDSVGLITARTGIAVTGGQLTVGAAFSVGNAGVATALGFVAGTSGLSGTLQTAAQANVTSLGTLTGLTVSGDATLTGASYNAVWDKSDNALEFGDNAKIKVGSGDDLNIYHDGNSYISNAVANQLAIQSDDLKLRSYTGTEKYLTGAVNGAVEIYYNDSKKFETTNDGTVTTGIATATGLDVADKITHTGDTNTAIRFTGADTISLETGGVQALEITSGQAVKFPGQLTGNNVAQILNHSDGFNFYGSSDSNTPNDFIFCAASSAASEKFRITDTGQVGINSNAPNFDLDIRGGGGRDAVSVGTTVFIYSNTHATTTSNKSELRFGFNHSGNNYAYGQIYLEENGGNAFDGNMKFGVPYNNGGGGSSTRHVLQLQGSTGNVGIGTTIPTATDSNYNSAALHIHQTGGGGSQIHLTNGATGGAAAHGAHISMWSDDDLYINNQESDGQLKFGTAGTTRVTIDSSGNATFTGSVADSKGDVRQIIYQNKTSGYTLVAADAGKAIHISTGGVTINNSLFSAGDAVTIVNNSGSSQTITQGSGVTLYNTGDDGSTGNKTLKGRGICTVWFSSASVGYISGNFD